MGNIKIGTLGPAMAMAAVCNNARRRQETGLAKSPAVRMKVAAEAQTK